VWSRWCALSSAANNQRLFSHVWKSSLRLGNVHPVPYLGCFFLSCFESVVNNYPLFFRLQLHLFSLFFFATSGWCERRLRGEPSYVPPTPLPFVLFWCPWLDLIARTRISCAALTRPSSDTCRLPSLHRITSSNIIRASSPTNHSLPLPVSQPLSSFKEGRSRAGPTRP